MFPVGFSIATVSSVLAAIVGLTWISLIMTEAMAAKKHSARP